MRSKFLRVFGVLCFALILVGSNAQIQAAGVTNQKSDLPNKQIIKKVGYTETPVFFMQRQNGRYDGIIIDYLNEIAKYTGWQYEYVKLNVNELSDALAEGSIDLIGGTYYSPELTKTQAYPDYNTGRSRISLRVRWEDESILNNEVSTLEGKTIGISSRATQTREYLNSFLNMYHVSAKIRVYSPEEFVDDSLDHYLESGEVDVLVSETADDSGKFRTIEYFDAQPHYIVCRKNDTETLENLNFALHQINLSNPNFGENVASKNFPHAENLKFYLTEEEKAYIKKQKTIRVLIPEQLYPLSVLEGKSNPTGITPDILDKISELTGLQIEYITFSASDAYPAKVVELFREKQANLVGCAVENGGVFDSLGLSTSTAYISLPRVYIRNKNSDFQRDGLTVAVLNRQRPPSNITPGKVLYFDTLKEVLNAINKGEADLGFSSAANIQYLQQLDFYPNVAMVTAELEDVHYCFASDVGKDIHLLTIINRVINSMSNQEMQQIRENHLKLPARSNLGLIRELLYNNVLKVTAVTIVILCIVIAGIYMIFTEKIKREKATLQLADAQSANRAKSVFLSHMSHDIRTPINGIIGMTHIAIQNLDDPVILKSSLEKISHASAQLDTLVNEVLEMSRIETGKMIIVEEPFDLFTLQKDVNAVISSMADHSDISYTSSLNIKHSHLKGSSVYIERVMVNILSNAIKYTPTGGKVNALLEEKTINETQGLFVFTVTDNGIGMSKEFLNHIFEPFAREHWGAGTTYTGTGLGMPITKELVELMKGSIQITSGLDEGTTVVIQLPLKYDFCKPENERNIDNSLSNLRILVVEDNELNSEIASYILQENGAEVELAENGQVAVDLFKSKPSRYYDIILMDLMMPVMDGYAATKVIRECNKADARSIPIIAITANAFIEDSQRCLKCGMNDHIAKPLDIDELLSKIKKYL